MAAGEDSELCLLGEERGKDREDRGGWSRAQ